MHSKINCIKRILRKRQRKKGFTCKPLIDPAALGRNMYFLCGRRLSINFSDHVQAIPSERVAAVTGVLCPAVPLDVYLSFFSDSFYQKEMLCSVARFLYLVYLYSKMIKLASCWVK